MIAGASWWQDFNTIGLAYDGVGVLALWVPSLWRGAEKIKNESGSYFDFNPYALEGAVYTRLDLTFGSILLFGGFLGQFVAAVHFVPMPATALLLWGLLPSCAVAYGFARRRIGARVVARLRGDLSPGKKKPAG